MKLDFEVILCANLRAQIGKTRWNFPGRHLIKVLARPINNVKQLCGQRKGGKHFTKYCAGLHEILASTGATFDLLSFVSMSWSQFFFDKILKCVISCMLKSAMKQNCKLLSKCRWPKPTKNLQNRRIFRKRNNVTLAELPSKLIRQTLVLTCSLRVVLLHNTLLASCNSCRSTTALTCISNTNSQMRSIKSGRWWSADITPLA